MPTVPRREQQITQEPVRNVPLQPSVPRGTFGGDTRPIDLAGETAMMGLEILQKERERADQIAIQDARIESAKAYANVSTEIKGLRGKDAFEAVDIAQKSWQRQTQGLVDSAKNENQRRAIELDLRTKFIRLDQDAALHMDSEVRKYDTAQTESYIQILTDDAGLNYTNPGLIAKNEKDVKQIRTEHSKRSGLSGAENKQLVKEDLSHYHSEIMTRMLNDDNFVQAEQYFQDNKDKIFGKDLDIIKRVRREAERREKELEAQREYDIFIGLRNNEIGRKDLNNMIKMGQLKNRSFINAADKYLSDVYDDDKFSTEEKGSRYIQLVEKITEFGGVDKAKTKAGFKGFVKKAKLDELTKFRIELMRSKSYLTKSQYNDLSLKSQRAFDDATQKRQSRNKNETLRNMILSVKNNGALSELQKADYYELALEMTKDISTIEEALKAQKTFKSEIVNATIASQNEIGDIVNYYGKKFRVVGILENGTPDLEEIK